MAPGEAEANAISHSMMPYLLRKQMDILQRIEAAFAHYPCIPREIKAWVLSAVKAGKGGDFLAWLQDNPEDAASELNGVFERARDVLGCDNKTLMRGTDFHSADLDPERFDAMIAELRGVNFLSNQGFCGIRLIPGPRMERGADVLASRRGVQLAAEIVCSSRSSYRWPGHTRRSSDLVKWIVDKYHEKAQQLTQTAKKEGCVMRLLVVVLNSYPALQLHTRHDYLRMLEEIWGILQKPAGVHLAIVTGMTSLGVGPDDCVFPPWTPNL